MRFQFIIASLPVLFGHISGAANVQNPLSSPTDGQQLKRGEPVNIRWTPTDPSRRVSLVLHQNDRVRDTIAQDITNSGNHQYTIPSKVKDGNYCIRILEALDNNKRSDVCNLQISDNEQTTTASSSTATTETETTTVSSTPESAVEEPTSSASGPVEVVPGSENATVIITATPETSSSETVSNQTVTETETVSQTVVNNSTITETATLPPTIIVEQTETQAVTINSTTTATSTESPPPTTSTSVVTASPSTVMSTIVSTITSSQSIVEPEPSPSAAAPSQEGGASSVSPFFSTFSCLVIALLFACMF